MANVFYNNFSGLEGVNMVRYIQHLCNLPLANAFKEDKAAYYKALVDARNKDDIDIIRKFMLSQYSKMLEMGIDRALD